MPKAPVSPPQPPPAPTTPPAEDTLPWLEEMPPKKIVAELDRYIVGQDAAKKAVAIAVRNRWRRAPAGAARGSAVPQGRGVEVHRGWVRRPRRRIDGPGAGGRVDQHGAV